MFADHWIIALLIGQVCSVFLLIIAFRTAVRIINKWSPDSASEQQIKLERQTYLISTLIRYVLLFQIISLFIFLFTVNNYLPGLIRGAMCASGTLTINPYGYPLLYIKIFAILIYLVYLFMDYLDHSEAEYPLTPLKFKLIVPIFILLVSDFIFTLLYFGNIDPQVIATCCSISFTASSGWNESLISGGGWIDMALILFYLIAFILAVEIILIKKHPFIHFITGLLFLPVAVYSLKYHFVKFIYALPTHNCLFDIFWSQYYYIGYILFGSLSVLIICLLLISVYSYLAPRLRKKHDRLIKQFRYTALFCTFLFVILNSAYWQYWIIFRI
ncbi:MAG: hypothetical protein P8X42_00350 [Calditrichaceae bacterium]